MVFPISNFFGPKVREFRRQRIQTRVAASFPMFDEERYLQANPDIARTVEEGGFLSGAQHFLLHGQYEMRDAGQEARRLVIELGDQFFDYYESAYREDHPDVRADLKARKFKSGFDHFLSKGYAEIVQGKRRPYSENRFVKLIRTLPGGAPPLNKEFLCYFAHHDRDGVVDDYVIEYIKALRNLNIDIVFITDTSEDNELHKIADFVTKVIVKNGAGRDFGSWYLAIKEQGLDALDRYSYLLLVNDSVYFPVADPKRMLDRMRELNFNFWGITDTRELGLYHIQSYFLAFDRTAQKKLLPKFLAAFDRNIFLERRSQIFEFEFNLSKWAVEENLSTGAFCSIDDIREVAVRDDDMLPWRYRVVDGLEKVNPTLDLWALYITRFSCPVLKRELIGGESRRPGIDFSNWNFVVDKNFLNPDLIGKHIRRLRGTSKKIAGQSQVPATAVDETTDLKLLGEVAGRSWHDARRLVLFSHYDPDRLVDDHVVESVRSLHKTGSAVVFITSTQKKDQLDKIAPYCVSSLIKNNVGRDYGSWYLGIKQHAKEFRRYQSVVWMNDSTYFPLFDPREMFASMEGGQCDFWGIVDSHFSRWHIMSWFWSFERRLVESEWFDWYLREYRAAYSKWDQIRNYEMLIPLAFKERGYKAKSYVTADEVSHYVLNTRPRHRYFMTRKDFTMTHIFWDVIVEKFRCPALKVELVRDNPLKIDLTRLPDVLKATEYDVNLIRNHLRRVGMVDEVRQLLDPSGPGAQAKLRVE